MPSVFPQALGPQLPQQPMQTGADGMFAPWVDPNAAQIAALQARVNAPQQPTFTPGQVQSRQDDNAKQYALGLLGQLSGNQDLGNVGGTVFKQALANRQPKYTDHGTYDPLSGEFNYSPDYLQERDITQLNKTLDRSGAQQSAYVQNQQRLQEKLTAERETRASSERNAALLSGALGGIGSGKAEQAGSDSLDSSPVFRGVGGKLFRYDANGQPMAFTGSLAPKASSAGATVDEQQSAGWHDAMAKAVNDMKAARAESPAAALPQTLESIAGTVPGYGEDLANALRSGPRQRFVQAINAYAESALHMATGAGFGEKEARSKIAELSPRWGEDDATIAQKTASLEMYLRSAARRAGKALAPPPGQAAPAAAGAPGAPAAIRDPYGLLGGQ